MIEYQQCMTQFKEKKCQADIRFNEINDQSLYRTRLNLADDHLKIHHDRKAL